MEKAQMVGFGLPQPWPGPHLYPTVDAKSHSSPYVSCILLLIHVDLGLSLTPRAQPQIPL